MTLNYGQFVEDPDMPGGFDAAREETAAPGPQGPYRFVFKRLLDILVVLLAAPFVVPLIAGLALAVALDGGKPFYTQERLGKGGRVFRMWKLRSMVADADQRLSTYLAGNPAAREEWEVTQKLRHDPRITRFGSLLRKSSLDELPQLWNVFIGDMSLVGPRPMMVNQRALYPSAAYYRMLPGITGYWQTAGRHRTSFAARAGFDAAYERDISLVTDLSLLVRTVGVVVKGTGC
jgi:lipopolysaccharide/colanic/teichoic acid biosynthesis glycosyltransferase